MAAMQLVMERMKVRATQRSACAAPPSAGMRRHARSGPPCVLGPESRRPDHTRHQARSRFGWKVHQTPAACRGPCRPAQVVVEPSGAAGVAAALSSQLRSRHPGLRHVGVILCGACACALAAAPLGWAAQLPAHPPRCPGSPSRRPQAATSTSMHGCLASGSCGRMPPSPPMAHLVSTSLCSPFPALLIRAATSCGITSHTFCDTAPAFCSLPAVAWAPQHPLKSASRSRAPSAAAGAAAAGPPPPPHALRRRMPAPLLHLLIVGVQLSVHGMV